VQTIVNTKIKICTPFYHGISKTTASSVAEAKKHFDVIWQKCEGTYIAEARNALIIGSQRSEKHPALEAGYTHYLQLDSDIGFTPENLNVLIEMDKPIVSGAYLSRRAKDCYVGGGWNITEGNMGQSIKVSEKGIIPVKWCGGGFLLIKREVLEKMEAPWFCHEPVEFKEESGVEHSIQTSEDIGFCMKAARFGYEILLNADCVVEHILDKNAAYGNAVKKFKAVKDGKEVTSDLFVSEVLSDAGEISTKVLALAQLVKNIIQQQN
jgi:hypothetical protein